MLPRQARRRAPSLCQSGLSVSRRFRWEIHHRDCELASGSRHVARGVRIAPVCRLIPVQVARVLRLASGMLDRYAGCRRFDFATVAFGPSLLCWSACSPRHSRRRQTSLSAGSPPAPVSRGVSTISAQSPGSMRPAATSSIAIGLSKPACPSISFDHPVQSLPAQARSAQMPWETFISRRSSSVLAKPGDTPHS